MAVFLSLFLVRESKLSLLFVGQLAAQTGLLHLITNHLILILLHLLHQIFLQIVFLHHLRSKDG